MVLRSFILFLVLRWKTELCPQCVADCRLYLPIFLLRVGLLTLKFIASLMALAIGYYAIIRTHINRVKTPVSNQHYQGMGGKIAWVVDTLSQHAVAQS